jgi:hypothetical protein
MAAEESAPVKEIAFGRYDAWIPAQNNLDKDRKIGEMGKK